MDLHLIAAETGFLSLAWFIAFFKMALGLGIVIFVHELGHFMVAKACGVKCEKFYVGFDFFDIKIGGRVIIPRSLFKFQYGETEYGIGIIPLGGYVKMLGQDDDPTKYADEMERSRASDEDAEETEDEKPSDEIKETVAKDVAAEDPYEEEELDPRSYQAKNVPQRMAIISAGVIMNLIFAVIFATFAYKYGVENTMCTIGSTLPGGPAYRAGIMPGDKIVQLNRDSKHSEYLRFRHDLFNEVVINGDKKEMEILVRRASTKDEEWVKLTPEELMKGLGLPSLGVGSYHTTSLNPVTPVFEFMSAGKSGFEGGDKILSINGTEVTDYVQARKLLANIQNEQLVVNVERKEGEDKENQVTKKLDLKVDVNPYKVLGLEMTMGPIIGIQPGSPAEGILQEGDVINKVNGKSYDPQMLSTEIQSLIAANESEIKPIELDVKRGKKTITVEILPRPPTTIPPNIYQLDAPWLCDELGVAYSIQNEVKSVDKNGPAKKSGLKPGDVITQVEFMATKADESTKIDFVKYPGSWSYIHSVIQGDIKDSKVSVTYKRDKKTKTVELAAKPSKTWNNPDRGLVFAIHQETHTAESWGEAFSLGVRETKESAMKVVQFLRKLMSGGISPMHLGGPFTIAAAATSEASHSTSRLLIFLTLLSANLAVVNFLPIPVLDGGHMMFLTYEGIFRRKPSEKWFVGLSIAGLAFILSLMVFVIGLDVWRFLG